MTLDLTRPHSYLVPARKAEPEPHARLRKAHAGMLIFCEGAYLYLSSGDIEILAMIVNVAADTVKNLMFNLEYVEEDRRLAIAILERAQEAIESIKDSCPFKQDLVLARDNLVSRA